MKTSESKSRSGYSQRPHVEREMVSCANGISPTGTSVTFESSKPVAQHSISGTHSYLSPGMSILVVELDCHAQVFNDLSPRLTPRGEIGVSHNIFAEEAVKAASHNSHYLRCLGSNSVIEGVTCP